MILFKKSTDNNIIQIKEKPFKLEREIQRLFEHNLQTIMNLELVKSECVIKDRRIDTLAFDPQSKSFVIIEYKRDRNTSVFDQGITYLNLMLQHKADFIVEYNECKKNQLKRTDVDWSQTRVAFVSPNFTENQIMATDFRDFSIELWEVKQYENGIIAITQIKKSKTAESIKQIATENTALKTVAEEIKTYTEETLLQGKSADIVALYEQYKSAILNLVGDIEISPKKLYVAFKKDGRNIVDIEIRKSSLKLYLNTKKGTLDDPKKLARDISDIGHWGNGDYVINITDDSNLEYIMSLIKTLFK